MIASARKLIGIYGGSFDPVHLGHLIIAQDCLEQAGLTSVVLVPTAQSPLKSNAPHVSDAHRLAMLERATQSLPGLEVSDFEIKKGGLSYSIETARTFRQKYPEADLFWIIGQDQLNQLPHWHAIDALASMVQFIVVGRPGVTAIMPPIPNLRLVSIRSHAMDISSTEVRERFKHGLGNHLFLPAPVSEYIQKNQLYAVV